MASKIAILGAGNIGQAIAHGLTGHPYQASEIAVTRRHLDALAPLREAGFAAGTDNAQAVSAADVVLLCVQPGQLAALADEIRTALRPARQLVISVITGIPCRVLREHLGETVPVVRAMPNTAITLRESMTCLAAEGTSPEHVETAQVLFDRLGRTLVIDEELMSEATALCACGVAFFLRAIRAASQGGIEIGFHAEEALFMAAQTARGAASLVLEHDRHPEREIDRVTTPMGCTIAGLNRMEHEGFSSALIQGIVTSAAKADLLGGADRG